MTKIKLFIAYVLTFLQFTFLIPSGAKNSFGIQIALDPIFPTPNKRNDALAT